MKKTLLAFAMLFTITGYQNCGLTVNGITKGAFGSASSASKGLKNVAMLGGGSSTFVPRDPIPEPPAENECPRFGVLLDRNTRIDSQAPSCQGAVKMYVYYNPGAGLNGLTRAQAFTEFEQLGVGGTSGSNYFVGTFRADGIGAPVQAFSFQMNVKNIRLAPGSAGYQQVINQSDLPTDCFREARGGGRLYETYSNSGRNEIAFNIGPIPGISAAHFQSLRIRPEMDANGDALWGGHGDALMVDDVPYILNAFGPGLDDALEGTGVNLNGGLTCGEQAPPANGPGPVSEPQNPRTELTVTANNLVWDAPANASGRNLIYEIEVSDPNGYSETVTTTYPWYTMGGQMSQWARNWRVTAVDLGDGSRAGVDGPRIQYDAPACTENLSGYLDEVQLLPGCQVMVRGWAWTAFSGAYTQVTFGSQNSYIPNGGVPLIVSEPRLDVSQAIACLKYSHYLGFQKTYDIMNTVQGQPVSIDLYIEGTKRNTVTLTAPENCYSSGF